MLALGWRGSARHWQRYETAYLLLAGLATPLVVSVHTVVSFDFAVAIVPGWHSTIFPPYFVAGAIYSGFAMVLTLAIPLRDVLRLAGLHHRCATCDNMAKVMLATGLIVAYGYVDRGVHGVVQRQRVRAVHAAQPHVRARTRWCYWTADRLQRRRSRKLLWFKRVRTQRAAAVRASSLIVNIGMWLERFVIVVTSLHRDFLPSSWGMYYPTIWDWATFIGTIGLFFVLLFLFIRFLPMISIFRDADLAAGVARAARRPRRSDAGAH